ncbi:hypothetical protein Dsin_013731 [Dipteronia sinensis]|uniref:RNase H type-1 domain-containing protein n=1 Tax=Dipteronia sinensis TaxID=43782 RepID=A0AAE0AKG1_9ROSI|nr:hypothetical protein Dsin_013731 [Dipteronia sinensis]
MELLPKWEVLGPILLKPFGGQKSGKPGSFRMDMESFLPHQNGYFYVEPPQRKSLGETVWESRNSHIFEGKVVTLDYATDLVKFRVGWWFKHHSKGTLEPITAILLNFSDICVDKRKVKHYQKGLWCPPGVNGLKFNVDGSSRSKPGPAGIGGVLRNSDESNTTVIMAIHKALELCASRSILLDKDIIIVSDSMVVVSWVNKTDDFGSLKHVKLIYDIRGFMKLLRRTSVVYNPRHTNSFADDLAKKGL